MRRWSSTLAPLSRERLPTPRLCRVTHCLFPPLHNNEPPKHSKQFYRAVILSVVFEVSTAGAVTSGPKPPLLFFFRQAVQFLDQGGAKGSARQLRSLENTE